MGFHVSHPLFETSSFSERNETSWMRIRSAIAGLEAQATESILPMGLWIPVSLVSLARPE
jgi:hypothetical protein